MLWLVMRQELWILWSLAWRLLELFFCSCSTLLLLFNLLCSSLLSFLFLPFSCLISLFLLFWSKFSSLSFRSLLFSINFFLLLDLLLFFSQLLCSLRSSSVFFQASLLFFCCSSCHCLESLLLSFLLSLLFLSSSCLKICLGLHSCSIIACWLGRGFNLALRVLAWATRCWLLLLELLRGCSLQSKSCTPWCLTRLSSHCSTQVTLISGCSHGTPAIIAALVRSSSSAHWVRGSPCLSGCVAGKVFGEIFLVVSLILGEEHALLSDELRVRPPAAL